jgi:hypothetical protein
MTARGNRVCTEAEERELETERERQGIEMIVAGLRQGISWMPVNSSYVRSFAPLLRDLQERLAAPFWSR